MKYIKITIIETIYKIIEFIYNIGMYVNRNEYSLSISTTFIQI